LLAALDSNDARKVSEELGDLLLQVAMQTQIAAEEGLFRFPDVVEHIVSKLIRRHPHVFGDAVVSGTDEVLANWEAIKRPSGRNNERSRPYQARRACSAGAGRRLSGPCASGSRRGRKPPGRIQQPVEVGAPANWWAIRCQRVA
jgi:hypothetical protein